MIMKTGCLMESIRCEFVTAGVEMILDLSSSSVGIIVCLHQSILSVIIHVSTSLVFAFFCTGGHYVLSGQAGLEMTMGLSSLLVGIIV